MRSIKAANDMAGWQIFCYLFCMFNALLAWIARLLPVTRIRLQSKDRTVLLEGRRVHVQEKAWQVLNLLQSRRQELVSRQEIIDTVWLGNRYTGEKGLNQAIWQLRNALRDNARSPSFIRTTPRRGYQWIAAYPLKSEPGSGSHLPVRFRLLATVSLPVISLLIAASSYVLQPGKMEKINVSGGSEPELVAENAYLRGDRIFVDYESGCRGIIEPSGSKAFGHPVISENGQYVAFTVTENASCKTVTLNVRDRSHEAFDFCPAG